MNWATMTTNELVFRLVLLGGGVALLIFFGWLRSRLDAGESLGCFGVVLSTIAFTLILGGIGGPDAVTHLWGEG